MIKSIMVRSPQKELVRLDRRIDLLEPRLQSATRAGHQATALIISMQLRWLYQRRSHMTRLLSK